MAYTSSPKPLNSRSHAPVALAKEHDIVVVAATVVIADPSPALVVPESLKESISEQLVFFARATAILALG